MAHRLDGRVAIVTGAGGGVGRAISKRLVEAGCHVMLADTDEGQLAATLDAVGSDGPGKVEHFHCDVCQRLDTNNLLAATMSAFDRLDILINAARRVDRVDFFDLTEQDIDQAMETNLKSSLLISQAAARKMIALAKDRDEPCQGAIVNISSIAAKRTLPELLPFSVSCAALDQLTRSMAVALAPEGVRVNGVAVGGIMTRSIREALKEVDDLRAEVTAATPLDRIGEPAEAAEVALYLASDAASFVTGQIVAVDGGRSLLDPLAKPAV